MADKSVAIRLSVKDAELVRATLERLGKDGDAAIRKIDKAARDASAGGGFTALESGINRLKTATAALGVGLSAGAFAGFVRGAINAADEVGELAEQLGVGVEKLQVYQYAAAQTGVKQEQLEGSFQKLTRTIGEALDGNDAAIASFSSLGVKILDAAGKARTTDDVFAEVADRIAAIEDPAKRAQVAFDLFGKAGQRLLPLLSQGAAGLAEYEAAARKAGAVWSEADIARAGKVADELAAMEVEVRKLAQSLALDGGLVPAMQGLLDLLNGKEIRGDGRLIEMLRNTRKEIELIKKLLPGFGGDAGSGGPGWLERNVGTAPWLPGSPEERSARAVQEVDRRWADMQHRFIASQTTGGGPPGERFMAAYDYWRQRASLVDYSADEFRAYGGGPVPMFPGDASAGGAANPVSRTATEDVRKQQEQITRTTEALKLQGEQYARTAEQRAVYDELTKAGIKASEADVAAARERMKAGGEAASQRDEEIVQIADLAIANHRKSEAEKAAADATREHEREQKRLTEQQQKASESLDLMLAGLQEEQNQLRMSERDRYVRQKGLEAEKLAIEAGSTAQDARVDRIKAEAAATYDLNQAMEKANRQREEAQRELERQAEEQRDLLLEPYREAWRSIQQMGADAIESMFNGSLKSAKDYWNEFKNIAFRALAQIASAEITVAIQGIFTGGSGPGGQTGISGLIGSLFGGGGSSPIAGTQNLPVNGFGGGLFGGNSGGGLFGIGSFLSRPLHSVGIGVPGLDPTGASAYLGLAESGGLGGFVGNLSIGQGLGALGGAASGIFQLMQGGTANTIGGIASLIGAGVSLIPGVGQILGPLIAIGGGLIGGLFGKKKPKIPTKRAQLYTGAPGVITSGPDTPFQGTDFVHTTPFGVLGYYGPGTNDRFDDPSGDAGDFLRAVADMDRAISELLTQPEIDSVAAALQGRPGVGTRWKKAFDNEGFDMVKDRLDTVLSTLYGGTVAREGLSGIARGNENIEELINRAGEVIQVGNAIKGIGLETTAAEDAIKDLNEQFDELASKAEQYGFAQADLDKIETERRRLASKVAGDFNKGVSDLLLGMEDPYALAQQQLEESQAERRKEALYLIEQYEKGLIDTLVDINKLEELFGKERVKLAEQSLEQLASSWKDFVDGLVFGPLSAKSNKEQYALAMAEYDDVRARAMSAFAANDNLSPELAAEFQREALAALQWSRTYNASSAATAALYQQILELAGQFGDIDVPGMATGGIAGPGLLQVGERGRELIRLFQPARIYSRDASDQMMGAGGVLAGIVQALRETAVEQIRNNADGQGLIVELLRTLIAEVRNADRERRLRDAGQNPTLPRRSAAG